MFINIDMKIVTKRFLLRDFVELDRLPFLNYRRSTQSTFSESNQASPENSARLFETFCTWACEQPRLNYQLAIVQRREPLRTCWLLRTEGKRV